MTQLKHESKISQIEALRPLDWIKCRQVKVQHECKFTPKKRQLSKKFLWVVKIVLPVRARPRQSCEMHRATPTLSLSTTPGRYFRGTETHKDDLIKARVCGIFGMMHFSSTRDQIYLKKITKMLQKCKPRLTYAANCNL
jgi:hypothetical protein